MTCQEMEARLDGWVDGTQSEAERERVAAHLASCARCREEARRLREVLSHAAALPRSVSPPRDLWPGIAARIGAERRGSWLRLDAWAPALAAAAAVVVAVGAAVLWEPGPAAVHTVVIPSPAATEEARYGLRLAAVKMEPGLAVMEDEYQAAANTLMEALMERQDRLDPETVATVQRNLAIIDEALADIHRALAKDPNRPDLARRLVSTHRKRVEVLRHMVKLSSALETS